ncbi:hypothetical protein ACLOJK_004567, partial [Asimina triloba]
WQRRAVVPVEDHSSGEDSIFGGVRQCFAAGAVKWLPAWLVLVGGRILLAAQITGHAALVVRIANVGEQHITLVGVQHGSG